MGLITKSSLDRKLILFIWWIKPNPVEGKSHYWDSIFSEPQKQAMQIKSRKKFKAARGLKKKLKQEVSYDTKKLSSQGLFDPTKKSTLTVRKISEMSEEEKKEAGLE